MNDHLDRDELESLLTDAATDVRSRLPGSVPPFDPPGRAAPRILVVVAVLAVGFFGWRALAAGPTAEQTVEAADPPAVVETTAPEVSDDPTEGVVVDPENPGRFGLEGTEPVILVALARPAVGGRVIDPSFGTSITRLTEAAPGAGIVPIANRPSAFNADESRILLYSTNDGGRHLVYELTADLTLGNSVELDDRPADIEQVYWSATDPNLLYYPAGGELVAFDVATQQRWVVQSFGCDRLTSGKWPNPPLGDRWGFLCVTGDSTELLVFDMATGVVRRVPATAGTRQAPMALPDGMFVVESTEGIELLDAELAPSGRLQGFDDGNLLLADGRLVGVSYDSQNPGTLVAATLLGQPAITAEPVVGQATGYPYPPAGTQLGGSGPTRPYVAAGIVGNAKPDESSVLDGEVIMVDFAEGRATVRRVAHHRTSASTSFAVPFVSVSPSGDYVVFASDWGTGTIDTYLVRAAG